MSSGTDTRTSTGTSSSTSDFASLLQFAQQKVEQGQMAPALEAIIAVLRAQGGEAAVRATLSQACEAYDGDRRAHDLASLLAHCNIAQDSARPPAGSPSSVGGGFGPHSGQQEQEQQFPQQPCLGQGAHAMTTLAGATTASNQLIDTGSSDSMSCTNPEAVPILAEHGRFQIVLDASSDGSSFVCGACGGVVSALRHEEHFKFWCPASP